MKGSITALVALVSLVSAQSLSFGDEPSCAIPCLTVAIASAGCALTDEGCQCGTGYAAIASVAEPCLLTACGGADLGVALSVGQGLCSQYSAAIAAVNATTTSTVLTSTSSVPAQTTTVTASTTSVPASSSTPATTSAAVISSSSSSNFTAATTSKPATVTTAGASSVVVGLGGVIALVVGLMVAL